MTALNSIWKQKKCWIYKTCREVKRAKKEIYQIDISDLGNLQHLKIVLYSDVTFTNVTDGASQGRSILFLVGNTNKYMPIAW